LKKVFEQQFIHLSSKLTFMEAQGHIYLYQSSRRRNDDYYVGLTSQYLQYGMGLGSSTPLQLKKQQQ